MAHHKPPVRIGDFKIRLRHLRRGTQSKLTRGSYFGPWRLPNPSPDGAPPSTAWVLYSYPQERRSRRITAVLKRKERRRILRRQEREAMRQWDESE